jgi:hypothetical protein
MTPSIMRWSAAFHPETEMRRANEPVVRETGGDGLHLTIVTGQLPYKSGIMSSRPQCPPPWVGWRQHAANENNSTSLMKLCSQPPSISASAGLQNKGRLLPNKHHIPRIQHVDGNKIRYYR